MTASCGHDYVDSQLTDDKFEAEQNKTNGIEVLVKLRHNLPVSRFQFKNSNHSDTAL